MTVNDRRLAFGVGLGRTGTVSLNSAFTALGWRSIHFPKDADTRSQIIAWLETGDRTQPLQLRRMESVDALTDSPVAACYEGLGCAYPYAKFVLTVRDTTTWLASCEALFGELAELFEEHLDQPVVSYTATVARHLYGGTTFDADRFARAQRSHDDQVTRWAERQGIDLLVLDVSDPHAYQVLGVFLTGDPVDGDFPHKNTRHRTIVRQARNLTGRR
jgi:hypothetical protein